MEAWLQTGIEPGWMPARSLLLWTLVVVHW
jgi:hypothetical protein